MKKSLVPFILSVVIIAAMFLIPVSATTFFYDSGYEIYREGDGWVINSTTITDKEMALPDSLLDGAPVTVIGGKCFENYDHLEYIYIPDSVISINAYAFSGCTSLKSVDFSKNLQNIYTGAFRYCNSLVSVDLTNTKIKAINNTVFYSCEKLEEVILPDTVQSIGSNAFAKCPALNKVLVPTSVTSISDYAFNNSTNTVIYCYTDSYAHQFAAAKDIPFVLLDAVIPTEPPTEAPTAEPTQPASEAPTQAVTAILGDVDGNGVVSITDATIIQRELVGFEQGYSKEMLMHGDIDNDGKLTAKDVTFVLRYLVRIEVPYPIDQPI